MTEQRQPYISPEQILDLHRRIQFTKGGLDSKMFEPFVAKAWVPPEHFMDTRAKKIGMRGAHVHELFEAIKDDLGNNPMVAQKVKELMMIAKLVYPDALERVNAIDARSRSEHDSREKSRLNRVGNIEKRKAEAQKNYDIVSTSIEARFRKMIRSLIAMARKEPEFSTMDHHDISIVAFLVKRKLATVSRDKLEEVAPSLLEMEKPFIEEFMDELVTYMGSRDRDIAVHQLRGGLL